MNNVLLDALPEEWNGYQINTWFQIGVQIFILQDDRTISDFERSNLIIQLLFENEDGNLRPYPQGEELIQCIAWFMGGWNHDRSIKVEEKKRLVDFDIDQWRIYADFRQIYGINLNDADLHWWEFAGMLWNMPQEQSSFLQVIDIRKKKIKANMPKAEKQAIRQAQYIYGLGDASGKQAREYTVEERRKIDDVDRIRERMKQRKQVQAEALGVFRE